MKMQKSVTLGKYINKPLQKFKFKNVDNFTTDAGIKIRRIINRPLRLVLRLATHGEIIVETYPKLEKGTSYIFAATHSFVEEVSAVLATIDRSAYSLMGTTQQLEHNPKIYANWLSGLIYVNREDRKSREESLLKMERILNSGSSILIFPEGGWNNTENKPVQPLFAGVYKLAKSTNCKVVPIASFNEFGSKNIYIRVGEPMELIKYEKEMALGELRQAMGDLALEEIFSHGSFVTRNKMGWEPRFIYMEQRMQEYLKVKWSRDVWDEELTIYRDKNRPYPEEVRKSFDKVNITHKNVSIFAPILVERMKDKKYDFNTYMHNNWNK